MKRLMLSCACAALLSAQFSAVAETVSASGQESAQSTREQYEEKRDRVSGIDKVMEAKRSNNQGFLDAPVVTDDAPKQEQKP